MTKITAVQACTLRIPLETPTSFSSRTVHDRLYTLVSVEGDDGHAGIGFCYGGSAAGGLATLAARELLAPVLIGATRAFDDALGTVAVDGWAWLGMLAGFGVVNLLLGALAYGVLLEET